MARLNPSTVALLLLALLAQGCAGEPADPSGAALPFLNMAPDVAYVGQEACRPCHFEQFGTFSRTGMGRSFYPMSEAEAVEDFTANNLLVVQDSGLHYRMEQRAGKYYQVQYMLDSSGNEIARDERELVYVLGSNNHSRSYVTVTNDKLFQAPVCWYPAEQIWELCPGYEFKNDHFAREITEGCVHCHNGVMRLVEGTRNRYEKPYPHGIGCERCHGPGQLHVERWKAGDETPTGEADPTIVDVRRLPAAERVEVCFQCHLGDAKASERIIRHDRPVASFRPGQKITEIVVPFRYEQQTIHDFGLSSQADRMLQSRCYKESDGRLECLTCHNPHLTVYREDRPDDFVRQPCLTCHAVDDCIEPQASRDATTPRDNCVSCHMRKAEADDQRFAEFTDHWIRRDARVSERDHRQRFGVEPIYPDRLASFPKGEQAFYAARAIMLLSEDAPESKRPPMWTEAERTFVQAIEAGFDTVESWFFLGKSRLLLGQRAAAETAFERAYAHDPTHQDNSFALAQALVEKGEFPRALEIFEAMLHREPDRTMALAEAGRTITLMGRPEEAIAYFEKAIAQEPWNPTLHLNLGKVLAKLGRFDEAAKMAEEAVRHNPDESKVWDFYEKAHEAAQRPREASEARRLVQLLSSSDP